MADESVHICFGKTQEHLEELERGARGDIKPTDWWTINSSALPGHRAAFYFVLPRSEFVATGIVAEKPYLKTTGDFAGMYRAQMSGIKMLARPIHLREARSR